MLPQNYSRLQLMGLSVELHVFGSSSFTGTEPVPALKAPLTYWEQVRSVGFLQGPGFFLPEPRPWNVVAPKPGSPLQGVMLI